MQLFWQRDRTLALYFPAGDMVFFRLDGRPKSKIRPRPNELADLAVKDRLRERHALRGPRGSRSLNT